MVLNRRPPIGGGSALAAGAIFLLGLLAGAAIGPIDTKSSIGAIVDATAWSGSQQAVGRGTHPVDILRVIDGDTFDARVHVWPGLEVTTRVRLRGIDAPEIKARCGEEYAKAQSAREALAALLAQGGVEIANVAPDKYDGRVVAEAATRRTADVSQALINAGLVRRYDGGRRDEWCP